MQCFVCREQLEEAARTENSIAYRGKFVGRYHITVCDSCYDKNSTGWVPSLLVPHLTALKLPVPDPDANALLPRD